MNLEEKLRVAKTLEEMGVDIIEAGFPIASNGDFEAVREVAATVKNSIVCGLARAGRKDIDRAWEALKGGEAPAHPYLPLDQPAAHEVQLQMEPGAVHQAVIDAITHGAICATTVEWSPEVRQPHRA